MASNRSQCVLQLGGKQSLQYEMQGLIDAGEDMWHAYNLIREGDDVTATTFRKVQKDSGGTSAGASERIKIKLTIKVEEVDFDAEGMCSSTSFP
jgi:stalled ribosome rescue protein Dom34